MSEPKASVQDLQDEGFRPEDFGSPPDFAEAATGYLARVLNIAGRWVAERVTQTFYDAAADNSYAADQMARAEVRYASAVLWQRRIKWLDANAGAGLQTDQYKIIQYLQGQADAAITDALGCVAEAIRASGGDASAQIPGSAISLGTVETGRFPSATVPEGVVNDPFYPGEGVWPW